MTKDEALKLALDAFGEIEWSNNSQWQSDRAKVAITAIKEALAQPEQLREENERLHVENRRLIDRIESIGVPVGVGGFATTTSAQPEQEPVAWMNDTGTHIDLNVSGRGTPLYTTPPQRIWVGLTNKDMATCIDEPAWDLILRKAEQILKEKNT